MVVNIVVAASVNNVIGKDNKLLWHLPNDLAFFKNVTWGMPVIMGRKTFEAVGKPLRGRTNIVVTRQKDDSGQASGKWPPNVVLTGSFQEALEASAATDAKECYVIGGGEIYRHALPLAHRIYLTRVLADLQGDTFFPAWDQSEWELTRAMSFDEDEKHAYPYRFEIWERK